MKKTIFVIFSVCLMGFMVAAQPNDYKKGEFFVGYSGNNVDTGFDDEDLGDFFDKRKTFHGFEVSGVYNFSRYVGLKGDFSAGYNKTRFDFNIPPIPPEPGGQIAFDTNSSVYNYLAGIQIKDNSSEKRVKPFAHILAGAGHARVKIKNLTCDPSIDCTGISGTVLETGFAGAFGGGLDIKLSDRVDLRLIQIDYNPIRLDGTTTNNFRFGIGFVFR